MEIASFNPRPARGPGAAVSKSEAIALLLRFQSSPSPGAGRCSNPIAPNVPINPMVSILAQPGGRALR